MVEDSEVGLRAALAAEISKVFYTSKDSCIMAKGVLKIGNFTDLLES